MESQARSHTLCRIPGLTQVIHKSTTLGEPMVAHPAFPALPDLVLISAPHHRPAASSRQEQSFALHEVISQVKSPLALLGFDRSAEQMPRFVVQPRSMLRSICTDLPQAIYDVRLKLRVPAGGDLLCVPCRPGMGCVGCMWEGVGCMPVAFKASPYSRFQRDVRVPLGVAPHSVHDLCPHDGHWLQDDLHRRPHRGHASLR